MKQKINDFFFKEGASYDWIAFFRISIGILLLVHFLAIYSDFEALFSTNGILPSDVLDVFVPDNIITYPKIVMFLMDYGVEEATTEFLFKIAYLSFSIFLIIGFIPQLFAFFLLFLQISLVKGSSFYAYGVDYFTSMSLFYLILTPSHYRYSVCVSFKKMIKKINITPYRRLFQLQLSIIYFFSGFDKALGFNWWNGESIWKAINLPIANHDFQFDFSFLGHMPILLILLGWGTIIIEMFYPLFIWIPKTRKFWLCLTISLHLGIALVINLYIFSAMMIIWNIAAFYNFNK